MAKASLITIGDEILIGQIIDTNGAWIGQELTSLGIDVVQRLSIGDDQRDIIDALVSAQSKSELVIVTGGLGPTKDDVTKSAITEFFGVDLYFDEENFKWITTIFERYGRRPLESHRQQCYLPSGCIKLENKMGTAPGMLMSKGGTHFFFTPGVPLEMKYIFTNGIREWIYDNVSLESIIYRTIHTAGVGESVIADMIEPELEKLSSPVNVAYLPGMHEVRIRILAQGLPEAQAKEAVQQAVEVVAERLGDIIYGYDGDSLPYAIGQILKDKGLKLCLAESCTGGYISHLVTSIPGSSQYYEGSIVSYSNALKMAELCVEEDTINTHGAVSEATVIQMAKGARERYGCDVALAVSGVAGPDGGTDEKPVGTVWMCVSDKNKTHAQCFHLGKTRVLNIKQTGVIGLNLIRKFLLGSELA